MIPYGRQSINEDDLDAVREVLRSDWLTQGPAVTRFEEAVATACAAPFGVAVCNATAALHIACAALNLGPGDVLWTSPNTFLASANCARYCGADVDFVDIDPDTYNMSVAALADKLAIAERAGNLPKVVVPVHFAGQSCDMRAIRELAAHYGFRIIEDASHAVGGSYRGRPIGSCEYSDICVFSFHPVKIVTTAEGGAAVTRDAALAERMRKLRSHGMTRNSSEWEGQGGAWYYEQHELGFNYRMTDMQAALGTSQLTRLEAFIEHRRRLAARYDEQLQALPVLRPKQLAEQSSAWHLYVIQLLHADRARVFNALRAAGIGVNVHYIPVHLQPYYRKLGHRPGSFPNAELYYSRALSLPMYAALSDAQQQQVVEALEQTLL